MPYDIPLPKGFIAAFVTDVFHLSGETLTLKNKFLRETNFSHRKTNKELNILWENYLSKLN